MALVTYNSTLSEYENLIRVKLKVVNPTLLKSGALGILTNYLAGIKYDALQFYSKAFQEMNVGLAQDFNSLLYHSTIYGTTLDFAEPSRLSSSLILPEIRLAEIEEMIYTIPRYTTFSDTNGMSFLYESEIKLSITKNGLRGTSWNPIEGNRKLTVTKAPNPVVPGTNVFLIHNSEALQYARTFFENKIPYYAVGESYTYSIGIQNIKNLKSVNVWVNNGRALTSQELELLSKIDPNNVEGSFTNLPGVEDANIEKLNIKFYKFDSSIRDHDIFVEIQESSLNFETGNGVHGAMLPIGSQLITEVQETQGNLGNVQNSEYILTEANVQEKYGSGSTRAPALTSINGLSTTGSHGGKNIEQVDGIRQNIFNQISLRQSVITENDYEILFKYQDIKPFVDAKFLDARAFVFIFNVVHDNDQIVFSTSVNYQESALANNPFYPLYTYNGVELISPFYYKNNGVNTIDAYIVNPEIIFSLSETTTGVDHFINAEYRVDLMMTYEFQRTQAGMTGKSFIEIRGEVNENYEYQFYASWLGNGAYIPLNMGNGFKYEINNLYTDEYCIIREDTTDIKLQVFDISSTTASLYDKTLLVEFEDRNTYNQIEKKQEFYKYFRPLPEGEIQSYNASESSIGYLDNYLSDIMSTTTDIYEVQEKNSYESILLRLPFIDDRWFWGKPNTEIYEILDNYFIVNSVREDINYNTQLTQAFHNTIDVTDKYFPYIFEENSNGIIDDPMFHIDIDLFLNLDHFIASKYPEVADFEIAVKIAIIKFMKEQEGFMIDYYETDLEKTIYNLFSPLIRNIRVNKPTMFMVNDSSNIYAGIHDNESFVDVLNFVPPYFYYDYDNIKITINM